MLHTLAVNDYFETSHFFLPSFKLFVLPLRLCILGFQLPVTLIEHGLAGFVLILEFSIHRLHLFGCLTRFVLLESLLLELLREFGLLLSVSVLDLHPNLHQLSAEIADLGILLS